MEVRRPLLFHPRPMGYGAAGDADNRDTDDGFDRRRFLKLMAASIALAGTGCSGPPAEVIVPYVRMPERLIPGEPIFYATCALLEGYGRGILVETNMGRPTKVEGNPLHPASLGSTDIFAQAEVLQFWDPDRSQAPFHGTQVSTWSAFHAFLQSRIARLRMRRGDGLHLLTRTVTSPTLAAQINGLRQLYPNLRWHAYSPLHDDNGVRGALQAFGRPVGLVHRFERARTVLSLDAEFLHGAPGSVRSARDFAHGRKPGHEMSRLYAVHCSPGLTGAVADHLVPLPPNEVERFAWQLARALGVVGIPDLGAAAGGWERVIAGELLAHRGASLIIAGERMPPAVHALVHHLNDRLGNFGTTVRAIEAVEPSPPDHGASLADLVKAMNGGIVDTLLIVDGNPVYDAPADLDFSGALSKVPFSAHLSLYRDETSRAVAWHLPASHPFEAWSDARAFDGTAGIIQPVVAPLYDSRSVHELLAALGNAGPTGGHEIVRDTWRRRASGDFEAFWRAALSSGLVPGSASSVVNVRARAPAFALTPAPAGPIVMFEKDPNILDGRYANNAWLQELGRPLTRLSWDNAILVSPATGRKLNMETGAFAEVRGPLGLIRAPVCMVPGHADGVLTLPLGYGRRAAGRVGDAVGFDAYRMRSSAAPWVVSDITVAVTNEVFPLAFIQQEDRTGGRDPAKVVGLDDFLREPNFVRREENVPEPHENLYPNFTSPEYAWGMAIDLGACVGCQACTIACQAENNIPVVGREEVQRQRAMHWIRVDRYYTGNQAIPRILFQPVPCMHCEKAPCEEVCPVGATLHDSEGLNLQVYNRCVGTRFCSNNCPYKVRRFNWLQYSNRDVESLKAMQNPEVTVRMRGVMEKCTYCLQRINRARIKAEEEYRRIRDGEIVTACQAACPTEAIVFGDLNDPDSRVNHIKASPLNYALLAELNTRPRTTYLARIANRNPAIEDKDHG